MSVFVNFKICDNASECSGVEVCPTGALYWDEERETVSSDNSKCISCNACLEACPAGAIYVAHNEKEEIQIREDIENDPRTLKELLVERYGASPVEESLLISAQEAMSKIEEMSSLIAIEIMDNDDAPCLINSVPVSEAFGNAAYEYYKVTISDSGCKLILDRFSVNEVPTLLVFRNHCLLVRVDGAVDNGDCLQREDFINKVSRVVNG